MMFYAIVGEDRPDSLAQRLAARPDHVQRLQALQAEGRLLMAGPFPAIDSPDPGPAGFTGSLIGLHRQPDRCRVPLADSSARLG